MSEAEALVWNHPNFAAGLAADTALLIYPYLIGSRNAMDHLVRLRKGAAITRRAALHAWDKQGRREFAARYQRAVRGPIRTIVPVHVPGESPFVWLINYSSTLIFTQEARFTFNFAHLADEVVHAYGVARNDLSTLELRWRIRNWLAVTAQCNIPPHVRLAAAAAWDAGCPRVAHEIVMAAAGLESKDGSRG